MCVYVPRYTGTCLRRATAVSPWHPLRRSAQPPGASYELCRSPPRKCSDSNRNINDNSHTKLVKILIVVLITVITVGIGVFFCGTSSSKSQVFRLPESVHFRQLERRRAPPPEQGQACNGQHGGCRLVERPGSATSASGREPTVCPAKILRQIQWMPQSRRLALR